MPFFCLVSLRSLDIAALVTPQLSDFSVRIRTTHCLSYLYSSTWSCFLVGEKKWFFLFMSFLIGLMLQSLTLLFGVIAIAMLALRSRQLVFFSIISISILIVALDNFVGTDPIIDTEYFMARLNPYPNALSTDLSANSVVGEPDSVNLSMLSYQSGWERIYVNLKDYYGIGLGFQQLGFLGSPGEIMKTFGSIGAAEV